jgi:hypothetical protein
VQSLVSKNEPSPATRHRVSVLDMALVPGSTVSRDLRYCLLSGYPGKPIFVSSVLCLLFLEGTAQLDAQLDLPPAVVLGNFKSYLSCIIN